ncbi:MAG: hydrogenase nickel incorporation protein HypA/HybF [Thermoproteota archaeon]|nr:hydrogenase nickel incorporation protein HypA/HybF [Thermoproteota archaeon]
MHEWALAEAVLSSATEIAEKEGLSEVTEVKITVGELQQIEVDILEFALSQLKTAKFGKTKFKIETKKAELKCRVCDHRWFFGEQKIDRETAEAIHFVPEIAYICTRCPECGSPDFEIMQGRGVWLERVKGVK